MVDKKRGAIGYKYPVHCFFFCCVHVFRLSRIQRLRQDFCFIIFKRDLLFSILVGSFVGFPIHADCRPIRKQQGKEPMASVPLLPHSAVFFFPPFLPPRLFSELGIGPSPVSLDGRRRWRRALLRRFTQISRVRILQSFYTLPTFLFLPPRSLVPHDRQSRTEHRRATIPIYFFNFWCVHHFFFFLV